MTLSELLSKYAIKTVINHNIIASLSWLSSFIAQLFWAFSHSFSLQIRQVKSECYIVVFLHKSSDNQSDLAASQKDRSNRPCPYVFARRSNTLTSSSLLRHLAAVTTFSFLSYSGADYTIYASY